MSLNNIQLKDLVVSELYRDNLLASEDTGSRPPAPASSSKTPAAPPAPSSPAITPVTPPAPSSSYKFLGNNGRRISIIVNAPGAPFLPDDQLTVLTRMLDACRMNIGDVAIVNHATAPIAIGELKRQLQPAYVLLFGPTPQSIGLPMDFPVFKVQPYDQCTYLTAPPLKDMVHATDESKLLKSKLWVCLKTLFEL